MDLLQCIKIITIIGQETNMTIINKYTGKDISTEYLALMEGIITNDEFELITLTIK